MVDETGEVKVASQKKGIHRRKRVIIPFVLLILGVLSAGAYWHKYLRGYVITDDAYIDGDAITVSAKILGRVAAINAAAGDTVTLGQLLVELDESDLRAQEAQAKAGLEYIQQGVPVAKIGLARAQEDFDRASYQFKNKVVPQEQYDHARKALEMAEAQYKVALSQVNSSKAQLEVIQTQLGNTRIFAPMSGVVARKWVVPGDVAQPGQPILTLYDLGNLWVTANLEETKLGVIHPGDPVRIRVDAFGGREFSGKVALIGAATASRFSLIPPNNASGNFTKVTQRIPVRISIESAGSDSARGHVSFLPGMSVQVRIRVRES